MIIVCDMNCNNLGNYFRVLGDENSIKQDKNSYIVNSNDFYPKGHCYKASLRAGNRDYLVHTYLSAIDVLLPEDYLRWVRTRYKGIKL